MYRRSKFVEVLHQIRQEMADEADHDAMLMLEMARSGELSHGTRHKLRHEPEGSDLGSNNDLKIEQAAT